MSWLSHFLLLFLIKLSTENNETHDGCKCTSPDICIPESSAFPCYSPVVIGNECLKEQQCTAKDSFASCTWSSGRNTIGRRTKKCKCIYGWNSTSESCSTQLETGPCLFAVSIVIVAVIMAACLCGCSCVLVSLRQKRDKGLVHSVINVCCDMSCGEACDKLTASHRRRMRSRRVHTVTTDATKITSTEIIIPVHPQSTVPSAPPLEYFSQAKESLHVNPPSYSVAVTSQKY